VSGGRSRIFGLSTPRPERPTATVPTKGLPTTPPTALGPDLTSIGDRRPRTCPAPLAVRFWPTPPEKNSGTSSQAELAERARPPSHANPFRSVREAEVTPNQHPGKKSSLPWEHPCPIHCAPVSQTVHLGLRCSDPSARNDPFHCGNDPRPKGRPGGPVFSRWNDPDKGAPGHAKFAGNSNRGHLLMHQGKYPLMVYWVYLAQWAV